jgi:hypothetical protein
MTQDEIIEMARHAGMEQDGDMWFSNLYKTDMDVHISHLESFAKLVAAKAIAELESQEPMAWYCCFQGQEEGEFFLFGSPNSERYPSQYKTPLYEHSPQRTWVGLTDEEKKNIFFKWYGKQWGYTSSIKSVMNSVEAKLKQKNGYAEEKNT